MSDIPFYEKSSSRVFPARTGLHFPDLSADTSLAGIDGTLRNEPNLVLIDVELHLSISL